MRHVTDPIVFGSVAENLKAIYLRQSPPFPPDLKCDRTSENLKINVLAFQSPVCGEVSEYF